uniref:Putative cell division control protein/ dna repair exonuclease n=1 Tax=Anopheles braziliensis TaxID=58242 RepID=A0A2M3Z9F3_9DIPT
MATKWLARTKKKFLRLHPAWRMYLIVLGLLVLYNEVLIYVLQKFKWSNIYCKEPSCVRILLVADPQILGKTYDPHFYAGIANYDSDRYLAWYYEQAVKHVQPHVIIFLGDLMDEGTDSTELHFEEYYTRFGETFPTHPTAKQIYIPGDNDIGGLTYNSPLNPVAKRRFRQYFSERPAWVINDNLTIYNINRITAEMTLNDPRMVDSTGKDVSDRYLRIFVSHMPVLDIPFSFTFQAIDNLKPSVIFSAHLHVSQFARTHRSRLKTVGYEPLSQDKKTAYKVHSFDLSYHKDTQELLEITVPTCSYRMGVPDIGYGYAVIDGTTLKYTVLWTTRRIYQLISYLVVLGVSVVMFLFFTGRSLLRRCFERPQHRRLPMY